MFVRFKYLLTKFKWKFFWILREKSEAKKYLHNTNLEHRKILAETVKSLKVQNLLDVGCGNGSNIYVIQKFINDSKIQFYGLDLSSASISAAKSRKYIFPYSVNFIQVDLLNYFKKNKTNFDCVLFDAMLMYLTPKELFNVLQKTALVSKNLIIHELNSDAESKTSKNGFIHNYKQIFKSLNFIYSEEKSTREDQLWKKFGKLFVVSTS